MLYIETAWQSVTASWHSPEAGHYSQAHAMKLTTPKNPPVLHHVPNIPIFPFPWTIHMGYKRPPRPRNISTLPREELSIASRPASSFDRNAASRKSNVERSRSSLTIGQWRAHGIPLNRHIHPIRTEDSQVLHPKPGIIHFSFSPQYDLRQQSTPPLLDVFTRDISSLTVSNFDRTLRLEGRY